VIQPFTRPVIPEHLRLHPYLLATYCRFLTVGRCLSFPLVVQIQTHSHCNGSCTPCPYRLLKDQLEQGVMEWDLYAHIAAQLASEPLLSRVSLSLQNEPLLDRRVFDWVRHFKTLAPHKTCRLPTNGTLLDTFSSDSVVDSGLDELNISLNAHSRESYDLLNTGLSYERVRANIESLLSNESPRKKVNIGFLVTRQNQDEVRQATRYWASRGARTYLTRLTNRGGALEGFENLRPDSRHIRTSRRQRLSETLKARPRQAAGCVLPFSQMCILFNGDCIICCHDWKRSLVVGNAGTSTLREIWNSDRMNEVRRLLLRKHYDQIDPCRQCSLVR
jgi:radical SAM protein with 4Fe4S-binding SPASM domain